MISKAKSIIANTNSIDYILREEKDGWEIARNDLIGKNGTEILAEFRETHALNLNCKNNMISIVLSPSNSRVYTNDEFLKFTKKHIKNLGLEKHQYIAQIHTNTDTPHVHIIANRIDFNGNALNDSYIGKKASASAEKIAKENGLVVASEVKKDYSKDIINDFKKQAWKEHNISVQKSENFVQYVNSMNDKGWRVTISINKQGQMQGFQLQHKQTEVNLKASQVHKNCRLFIMEQKGISFENLNNQLEQVKSIIGEVKSEKIIEILKPNLKVTKQNEIPITKSTDQVFGLKNMKQNNVTLLQNNKQEKSIELSKSNPKLTKQKEIFNQRLENQVPSENKIERKDITIPINSDKKELIIPKGKQNEVVLPKVLKERLDSKEFKNKLLNAHASSMERCPTFQKYVERMHSKGFRVEPIIIKNKMVGFQIRDLTNGCKIPIKHIAPNIGIKDLIKNNISFSGLGKQLKGLTKVIKGVNGEAFEKPQNLIPNIISSSLSLIKLSNPLLQMVKSISKVIEISMKI